MYDIVIHADGACSPNPGVGGWAATIEMPRSGEEICLCGGMPNTSNNVMELTAALRALQAAAEIVQGSNFKNIQVRLDSQYVMNGIESWLPGWKAKGWKKADGKPVVNVEIWKEIDATVQKLVKTVSLHLEHVKGHAGDAQNERVDGLAVEARLKVAKTGEAFEETLNYTLPAGSDQSGATAVENATPATYATRDVYEVPDAELLNQLDAEGFDVLQILDLRRGKSTYRIYLRRKQE